MPQEKRKFFKYSEEALARALRSIREQNLSTRAASKAFGVPRATLQDRIKGRVREGPRQMGRDTVLTKDEESKIVKWLIDLCKCGFPQKKSDLLDTVENIVTADKRQTPFTNYRPGEKWYKCFLKRHPELSLREPEGLTKGRAVITEEYIRKWFSDLKAYLEETDNLDIMSDPERILNGDESGFNLCPKTGKILGPKGATNILEIKRGNDKENITTLLVFTASGKTAVPCVVFKYVRIPKAIIDSSDPLWHITKSDSGWMKSDVFFEYVSSQLLPWLQLQNIKFPVIFFVDGHKSHLTMELSQFCERNGIILYSLPPNTTHMMQPADVAVFKPLKSEWKKVIRQWLSKPENIHSAVTKTTFCPLLKTVLEKPSLPEYIKNGFKKCGLFPFDPDAVDYTKCVQNYLESVVNNEVKEDPITNEEIVIAKKVLLAKFKDRLEENWIINDLVRQLESFKTVPGFREEIEENVIDHEPPENELGTNNEDPVHHSENPEDTDEWLHIEDIPIIFVNDNDSVSELMNDVAYDGSADENNVQKLLTGAEECVGKISGINEQMAEADIHEVNIQEPDLRSDEAHGSADKNDVQELLIGADEGVGEKVEIIEQMAKTDIHEVNIQEPELMSDDVTLQEKSVDESSQLQQSDSHAVNPSDKPVTTQKSNILEDTKLNIPIEKFLYYPTPITSRKRRNVDPQPAAISSPNYRAYLEERSGRIQKKVKKSKIKNTEKTAVNKSKERCWRCKEELDSDVDEGDEEHVGCDNCPKWYHLKCTGVPNTSISELKQEYFKCDFC